MALLPYSSISPSRLRLVSSDPVAANAGDLVLNTSTNQIKVFYGNTWQVLHTLEGAKINILQGQPIGLMGVTYAEQIN